MTTLRAGTEAARIDVIAFPHYQTIEKLDDGFQSPTVVTFEALLKGKIIDSFIDLTTALHCQTGTAPKSDPRACHARPSVAGEDALPCSRL